MREKKWAGGGEESVFKRKLMKKLEEKTNGLQRFWGFESFAITSKVAGLNGMFSTP